MFSGLIKVEKPSPPTFKDGIIGFFLGIAYATYYSCTNSSTSSSSCVLPAFSSLMSVEKPKVPTFNEGIIGLFIGAG